MNLERWLRIVGMIGLAAIIGAPSAALVTLSIASAVALLSLVLVLAFETVVEGDRRRVRDRERVMTKPDRAVRAGQLPKARLVARA